MPDQIENKFEIDWIHPHIYVNFNMDPWKNISVYGYFIFFLSEFAVDSDLDAQFLWYMWEINAGYYCFIILLTKFMWEKQ